MSGWSDKALWSDKDEKPWSDKDETTHIDNPVSGDILTDSRIQSATTSTQNDSLAKKGYSRLTELSRDYGNKDISQSNGS